MPDTQPGGLDGPRVLDVATLFAGPLAGTPHAPEPYQRWLVERAEGIRTDVPHERGIAR